MQVQINEKTLELLQDSFNLVGFFNDWDARAANSGGTVSYQKSALLLGARATSLCHNISYLL